MVRKQHLPIFVVGYMHSGTSLILNILKQNSEVFACQGETRFFEINHPYQYQVDSRLTYQQQLLDLIKYLHPSIQQNIIDSKLLELINNWSDHNKNSHGTAAHNGRLFSDAMDFLTAYYGKFRWVEKTPTHVFYVDEIVKAIPEAYFIHVVRDVRDILASKKTRRQTVWTTDRYTPEQRPQKHIEKFFDPILDTLSWKSAIGAWLQNTLDSDYSILVRYEDLVQHPEQELRRICATVGLEFELAMIELNYRNAADPSVKMKHIQSDSVERWRKILSPAEVVAAERLANKELKILGYQKSQSPWQANIILPLTLLVSVIRLILWSYRRIQLYGIRNINKLLYSYLHRVFRLR